MSVTIETMRTTRNVPTPPDCCLCGSPAGFDSPVDGGRWGYLCEPHMRLHGSPAIGTRIVFDPEPERTDADIRADVLAAIEAGDYDAFEDACGDRDPMEFL